MNHDVHFLALREAGTNTEATSFVSYFPPMDLMTNHTKNQTPSQKQRITSQPHLSSSSLPLQTLHLAPQSMETE